MRKKFQENNEIINVQKMLINQMRNLSSSKAKSEIELEVKRSGALSQNAQAYLKAVGTSLRVKDMTKKNPEAEQTILEEIGVINAK